MTVLASQFGSLYVICLLFDYRSLLLLIMSLVSLFVCCSIIVTCYCSICQLFTICLLLHYRDLLLLILSLVSLYVCCSIIVACYCSFYVDCFFNCSLWLVIVHYDACLFIFLHIFKKLSFFIPFFM